MKTSLKNLLLCAVAAVGLSAAGSASAVSILNFSGNAVINDTSLNTANSLEQFFSAENNPDFLTVGINSTGIFSSLTVGSEFTANSPLTYQGGVEGLFIPVPLFSLSGFSYVMTSVSVLLDSNAPNEFLILTGTGAIVGPGSFNIPADFSLTTQGPATPGGSPGTGNVTISGTLTTPFDDFPNVPEGGSAILLMGMGLIGVETLRRRLVKAQA